MAELSVLYQSSGQYIIPTAISLCSLLENNKEIDDLRIYLINDGFSAEDEQAIVELALRYNRTVSFIDGGAISAELENIGVSKWKGSYTTYLKLFAINQIESNRILYIDSDTLVTGSLKELIDISLENYAVGMVDELMPQAFLEYLGIDNHFNGGVVLFNLDYWRANDCDRLVLNKLSDSTHIAHNMYADQALLNLEFCGKIKRIPVRFNYTTTWYVQYDSSIAQKYYKDGVNNGKMPYSVAEFENAKKEPAIIHYTLCLSDRLWLKHNFSPFIEYYNYYLQLLKPWKDIDSSLMRTSRMRSLYLSIANKMPKRIRQYLGWYGYVYAVEGTMKKWRLDVKESV